jgi:hypothetical protein
VLKIIEDWLKNY